MHSHQSETIPKKMVILEAEARRIKNGLLPRLLFGWLQIWGFIRIWRPIEIWHMSPLHPNLFARHWYALDLLPGSRPLYIPLRLPSTKIKQPSRKRTVRKRDDQFEWSSQRVLPLLFWKPSSNFKLTFINLSLLPDTLPARFCWRKWWWHLVIDPRKLSFVWSRIKNREYSLERDDQESRELPMIIQVYLVFSVIEDHMMIPMIIS